MARTFCPFIVNFLTVRDPIQLRTQIRFMQIQTTDVKDAGFTWTGGGVNGGPSIALGFSSPLNGFSFQGSQPTTFLAGLLNHLSYGITGTVDATATLELLQNIGITKILRDADLFLTNGQPGWYSEGEVQSYVSAAVTTASSPPLTTLTASSVFLGVNMDISPLNLVSAGGVEPAGPKDLWHSRQRLRRGFQQVIISIEDSDPEPPPKSARSPPIRSKKAGVAPIIDNTVKYVDENRLIGLNISTQLTLPNGGINGTQVSIPGGGSISLPDFFVRTTRTRANLRDGQTIAINGLIDKEISNKISQVPFFASLPLFGNLFKAKADTNTNEEVIVLVTPHIVRMRDADSARYPKPALTELQDMAREDGQVPIIKPVRYDAQAVDLRPASPKDMKDAQGATEGAALSPHATGGMQTLQPPVDSSSAAPPATDNAPAASQPSGAPLAPSSTLP